MAKDKYKEFLNYMHNELGISKADIRQWTHDAIYEVAENYVKQQFSSMSLNARIMSLVRDKNISFWDSDEKTLDQAVKKMITAELTKDIKLDIKFETKHD